jgi:putative flavoprotein involved in K+ transport
MVARVPRRYRGKDIMMWLFETKFFDMRKEDIPDPAMLKMKAPQLTGVGRTKTISLQSLAKKGATILGKLENAQDDNFFFQPNASMHVKFADTFSGKVKNMIDEYITKNQLNEPAHELDKEDMNDDEAICASDITSLNCKEKNISTMIWSTGFGADFSYIKLPVFDEEGNPKHYNGVSELEGLYFLGLQFLRARKSGLIYGAKEDAKFIAEKVYENSRSLASTKKE